MQTFRRFAKPVIHVVLFGFLALTLHLPAQAALIGTDTVLDARQVEGERDRLRALLDRNEVKQALQAQGANADEIQARVDALTDTEVQQLAAHMDGMPAGGGALGLAVFVFLVLLLTDILGYTDIFPFVKKPAQR